MLALAVLLLQPAPPEEAARRFTLPDGFRAQLFAGEPDLVQPIAMTTDARGRLWVVETMTYPGWKPPGAPGQDRISVFEDVDGDGRFDRKKVFLDTLSNLSGIEVGFGGVWVTQVPYLTFIPDRDGDDAPDGPPEVVLDGWDLKAQHNVVNGLRWGPDGWLYGLNGILSNSRPGRPGQTDRALFNCGVWRIHPRTRTFEVFAWGTTNPWGVDWDARGEMFITNCVIKHAFHVVPGGHYERMFGQDVVPGVVTLMESPADHLHWGGGAWTESRGGRGAHDVAGGGHAHAGALIYQGDNWPPEYRGRLFTSNIHGNRINQDAIERAGSGYVIRHQPDLFRARDPWFRALELRSGPDGGVYVSDWTDTGECHNYVVADRANGRIYKITYGAPTPWRGDLAKLSNPELAKLLAHPNDWFARHARRLLAERQARDVAPALETLAAERPLQALWTLHGIGALDEARLLAFSRHADEAVRAWAVRLLLEPKRASDAALARLREMAVEERSAFVRLHLAAALQRLPLDARGPLVESFARSPRQGVGAP
ncbi:MAG TPA: PVC-type heme-binding CxxCH protein, partial [Planctomycetota bacterium]|nr:PVC-type heme-binding CxxCH protein [Planctomycetota bacterium]